MPSVGQSVGVGNVSANPDKSNVVSRVPQMINLFFCIERLLFTYSYLHDSTYGAQIKWKTPQPIVAAGWRYAIL